MSEPLHSPNDAPSSPETTDEKKSLPWRKIFKLLAIINTLLAIAYTVFGALVLDVLTGLAKYDGAGKVVMTILYCGFTFGYAWVFAWFAEFILGVGAFVCLVAGSVIFGGKKKQSPTTRT